MPRAVRNGHSLYYEVSGPDEAPPLVLLRGAARTLEHWQRVREELEDGFKLVLIDHLGTGRSDPLLGRYRTPDMARDVCAVLDHAAIARASVFGVSLGGMVAQQLAIAEPQRVERLVLGATSAGGRSARPVYRAAAARLTWSRFRSAEDALRVEAELLLSPGFRRSHPEVIEHWRRLATRYPTLRATVAVQLVAAMRHDTFASLDRIAAPTLVISSDVDRLVPPDNSRVLAARIERSELAWIRDAGHDFATEAPVDVARMLTDFILG